MVPDGYDLRVITRSNDLGDASPLPVEVDKWTTRDGVAVRYVSVSRLRNLFTALSSVRRYEPDLMYVNSFFDFSMSIVPQLMRRIGYIRAKQVLLAPRGEFGEAAYASKSMKKRLFANVYRALGLHRGIVWHASSIAEKADIQRVWGAGSNVVVRQNDTLLPAVSLRPGVDVTEEGRPLALVSLGRIVEHKGLHLVLEGLADMSSQVTLDVYGPDEDEVYMTRCKDALDRLPKTVTVRFHAAVPHENVRDVLAGYDALVMPTAGENFGHVIAESLSVACPVICSNTTPWSDVLHSGGGVVVGERTSEAWEIALAEYALLNSSDRANRRFLAANAYDKWRGNESSPHVFDLVKV